MRTTLSTLFLVATLLLIGCTPASVPNATVTYTPITIARAPDTETWTPVPPTFTTTPLPTPMTMTPMITYWRGLWTLTPPSVVLTVPQNVPVTTLPIMPASTPLPTSTLLPTQGFVPPSPLSPTALVLGDIPAMELRLRITPVLSNINTESVRAAFVRGQALGNRADVFTVIGDSNSTNGDFLAPIGSQFLNTCSYGNYAYLIDTVGWFSADITFEGANSFTHDSITANRGFNSAAAFDPIWASSPVCLPNETPLLCEFRATKPSAVVIMLGGIDINDANTESYARAMQRIVETALSQGIIPILTTFVVLPNRNVYARSLEFNVMLIDIANAYQIPLINLWAPAQTLPNFGIGPDRTHLKAEPGAFCDFTGAETQYGGTLRNLLTLQALDALRREVIAAPPM